MKKVLVACDDKILSMLYADELAEEGYDVVPTSRLTRLLVETEQEKPALVLVDCRMDRYLDSDLCRAVMKGASPAPIILCVDHLSVAPKLPSGNHVVLRGSNLKPLKAKIREVLQEDGPFFEQAAPIPEKEIPLFPVEIPLRRGGGPYAA